MLDRPLTWPVGAPTVGAAVAQIAEAADVPFVVAPSAESAMGRPAPRLAGVAPRVRTGLAALNLCVGLEIWLHDGALVLFGRGDRPALLSAASRELNVLDKVTFPATKATLDIEDMSPADAYNMLGAAFGVPVVFSSEALTGGRTRVLAEGIDLATAAAIVAEATGRQAQFGGGAVIMTASIPAPAAVDTAERAADIPEARRLAGSQPRSDAGRTGD
jgi:hypothetical protein